MRKFKPDAGRGIIVPTSTKPTTFVRAKPFTKPNTLLDKVDRLRQGGTPNIAVIRSQGGIGDVMMTIPTVRRISEKYQTDITFGTDFDYLDGALPAVVEGISCVKEIVPWRDIQPDMFDAVIDLTCPCIAHEQPHASPINRVDLFARHAGVALLDHKLEFVHTEEELNRAHSILETMGVFKKPTKLVLVQPSSSTNRRDLPYSVLRQLVRNIISAMPTARALVFTHDEDSSFAKEVSWEYVGNAVEMKNYKVRDIAAFMKYCDLVLCPDSSVLHLAGALEKKTLTFFGPTDARARINYYPNAVAITPGQDLRCWPCWYSECKSNYLCWKRVDLSLATRTALQLLDSELVTPDRDLITFGDLSTIDDYEIL